MEAAAWTVADLQTLRDAMKSGTRSISIGGRRREFQSIPDMIALEIRIVAALAAAISPARPRVRRATMAVSRG